MSPIKPQLESSRYECIVFQSGVSLVDSPGIGENTEMGNVVKDYVMKNDVFGFVFTVASNRAGGVLNKVCTILTS